MRLLSILALAAALWLPALATAQPQVLPAQIGELERFGQEDFEQRQRGLGKGYFVKVRIDQPARADEQIEALRRSSFLEKLSEAMGSK